MCIAPRVDPSHKPFPKALPEPLSATDARKATAKHWHKFWVVSGLKPTASLSVEELIDLQDEFGTGPFKVWGNDLIQGYCAKATKAIKSGQPLPAFRALGSER